MAKKKTFTKKRVFKKAFKKIPKKVQKKTVDSVYQPKIWVIGIGGGGGSIVSEIAKNISRKKLPHLGRIKFIVANVDYQAIKTAPRQAGVFYFGQELTHGLGCGMNVGLGEQAALQAKKKIEKLLKKSDFCIFITCLGGGTGSGAAPVFAEVAKDLGVLSLGIFTLPFRFEGRERSKIARTGLEKAKTHLNALVIMPNQRIFRIVDQKTPIHKSLAAMNNILVKTLEGFIETLYLPGLINLDFSDFRAILERNSDLAYLHCQDFSGLDRAEKVVKAVLENPLIEYKVAGVDKILFSITGSKDIKMAEIAKISETIFKLNPQAKIIFGLYPNNRYKNKIKITLLAVGCETKKPKPKRKKPKPQLKIRKEEEPKKPEIPAKKVKKKKKVKVKKPVLKKKKLVKKKKPKIAKKTTVRRNALDLHKQVEADEQKMLEEESKWDIPAFLRETEE